MLFFLDESVGELFRSGQATDDDVSGISDIAASVRRGDHIVLAHRLTFEAIIDHEDLGRITTSLYRTMLHKSVQLFSVKDQVKLYVEVSAAVDEASLVCTGINEKLVVPLRDLTHGRFCMRPDLILENLTDKTIFDHICKWYIGNHLGGGFRSSFTPVHGGGGQTHFPYAQKQNDNVSLCLCVVDSDKKYPDDDIQGTATSVTEANEAEKIFSQVLILGVHELENLVPLSVLRIVGGDNLRSQSLLNFFSASLSSEQPPILYWDTKSGLKCNKVNSDASMADYWLPIYTNSRHLLTRSCSSGECASGCGGELIPQWPHRVETTQYINNNDVSPIDSDLYIHEVWNSIGEVMVSWGLSQSRVLA